ncbi:MAG: glycosyltransferase [Mycoplasmataceae bacterium]|nr:glycosyltransferase [Mycoplasmataceae bacterium]
MTFIIPAYNCKDTIVQLLSSFDYEWKDNFEIIIVDDGSTISFKNKITNFLGKYPNTIHYIRKENGNWGSVINYVKNYHLVHGHWVKIIDADDLIYTTNFFAYLTHLQNSYLREKYDLVISSFLLEHIKSNNTEFKRVYGARGKIRYTSVDKFYNINSIITHHSISIKKELFYALVDLPEKSTFMDTGLIFQLLLLSKGCVFLPKKLFLYIYRVGNPNQSIALRNFIKSKEHIFRLIKFITKFNINTGISDKRRRVLQAMLKRVIYLIVMIISVDPNKNSSMHANEILYLKSIIKDNLGERQSRLLLLSNPFISLIYFRQSKIIKIIYTFTFQRVNWGVFKAIKAGG